MNDMTPLNRLVDLAERRCTVHRPPNFTMPDRDAKRRRLTANALGLGASASIMLGIAIGMILILVDPPPVPVIGEGMASSILVACALWVVGAFAWLVWGCHR